MARNSKKLLLESQVPTFFGILIYHLFLSIYITNSFGVSLTCVADDILLPFDISIRCEDRVAVVDETGRAELTPLHWLTPLPLASQPKRGCGHSIRESG